MENINNNKNVLRLKKIGCDFFKNDAIASVSDIGNYRVRTEGECIRGKDGRIYFLEFTNCIHLAKSNALVLDTAYTNEGGWFRNLEMEAYMRHLALDYTTQSILAVVNEISIDHYTDIEFVER